MTMVGATAVFRRSGLARIVASFAGLSAALVALVFVGLWLAAAHLLRVGAQDDLAADLASFAEVYAQRAVPGLREAVERRAAAPRDGRVAVLLDRDGAALAGDRAALGGAAPEAGEARRAGSLLIQRKPLPGGFALLVAHDRARDDALLRRLAATLAGLFAVAALFGLAGGVVVGRAAMGRVEAVNAVLRRVGEGDLAARAPRGARADEFDALAQGLNATLDRLAAQVAGLKATAQRIAHEMRSPLAHLRDDLDAERKAADPEAAARLGALVDEVDAMIATFGALLDVTLAEAAAGDPKGLAPVALEEIVAEAVELYEAVAEERGVALAFAPRGAATIMGDRRLLLRLFANLIDNAIKFSPPGGAVEIGLTRRDEEAVVMVRDHGPGVPEGFETQAFDLFARAPQARATPGHGLGLALARAVATRHAMTLALENARPGLRVALRAWAVSAPPAGAPARA